MPGAYRKKIMQGLRAHNEQLEITCLKNAGIENVRLGEGDLFHPTCSYSCYLPLVL